MSGARRPAMRGLRRWLALAGVLIVLGLAPVGTAAAASARLADAGLAAGVVHRGDSVTVRITVNREVFQPQCLASLDQHSLPVSRCEWNSTTPDASAGPTSQTSPGPTGQTS